MPIVETDDQIKALETQVRTLRRVVYSMCGLFVAEILVLVMVMSMRGIPDVIKAKIFEVVTTEGKYLVQLRSFYRYGTERGVITTLNEDGQDVVQLGVTTTGEGAVGTFNGRAESCGGVRVGRGGKRG